MRGLPLKFYEHLWLNWAINSSQRDKNYSLLVSVQKKLPTASSLAIVLKIYLGSAVFFFISTFEFYVNRIAETPFAYLKSRELNSRSTDKIYRVTLEILSLSSFSFVNCVKEGEVCHTITGKGAGPLLNRYIIVVCASVDLAQFELYADTSVIPNSLYRTPRAIAIIHRQYIIVFNAIFALFSFCLKLV